MDSNHRPPGDEPDENSVQPKRVRVSRWFTGELTWTLACSRSRTAKLVRSRKHVEPLVRQGHLCGIRRPAEQPWKPSQVTCMSRTMGHETSCGPSICTVGFLCVFRSSFIRPGVEPMPQKHLLRLPQKQNPHFCGFSRCFWWAAGESNAEPNA